MFFRDEPRKKDHLSKALGLLLPSLALACSATAGPDSRKSQEFVSDGDGGWGGGSTAPSTGAGGDELDFDAGNPDPGIDETSACAKTSSEAQGAVLDLIILLDRSGSMYGTNWTGATTALQQFVQDPASDGINVGILYFPIDSPSDGLVCNHIHYDDLAVSLGPLPANTSALVQSIEAENPNGGSTPMFGALEGALFHATAYKDANPNHKVVLVFASDGDPNSCPDNKNDIPNIAFLAKSAYDYNGVETYDVALAGASVANLDKIAAAGGTGKAFDVTQNVSEFSQKMAEIRENALACEYVIPAPPGNEPLEPGKVAVKHVGSAGENEIPHADSAEDCGAEPGWFYDNPANPTKIALCPASCKEIGKEPGSKVSVLFGCKPKLN
jgi:hypothetical protein